MWKRKHYVTKEKKNLFYQEASISNKMTPFVKRFLNSSKEWRDNVATWGLDHRFPLSSTSSSNLTHLKIWKTWKIYANCIIIHPSTEFYYLYTLLWKIIYCNRSALWEYTTCMNNLKKIEKKKFQFDSLHWYFSFSNLRRRQ